MRRQVKRVRSRLVYGLPKNNKERRNPVVRCRSRKARDAHCRSTARRSRPALGGSRNAGRVTATLLFTTTRNNAINRSDFNPDVWHPAVEQAGIERTRAIGMHALRHFYASALLDAGETVKALAAYLGHADPGFTLRTYTHLMPANEERTRAAIDALFGAAKKAPTPWRRPRRALHRRFRSSTQPRRT